MTRIDGLDLLRGVAVGLVLVRHATGNFIGGAGIIGVVIFFTLSGYLITGLLLRDLHRFGRIRWGRFYLHRAFRLVPALLAMVLIVTTISLIWNPAGDRDAIVGSALRGVLYVADLPLPGETAPALGHLWTLAAEEQFYLVWPLLLLFAFRRGISAVVASAAVGAVVLVTGWGLLAVASQPSEMYILPTSWASAMAVGAVACALRHRFASISQLTRLIIAIISAVILIGLCFVPDAKYLAATYIVGAPLIAVCTVGIILLVETWERIHIWPGRWLVWMGTISYAAYLWNLPIVEYMKALEWPSPTARAAMLLLSIPMTLAVAQISWVSVEAVGRRMRKQYDSSRPTAADLSAHS